MIIERRKGSKGDDLRDLRSSDTRASPWCNGLHHYRLLHHRNLGQGAKAMTTEQIKWAVKHDWFISEIEPGVVLVRDEWTSDGELHSSVAHFGDYQRLREWAGY